MNAGFSNLTTLKAWLLPPDAQSQSNTNFDAAILALGLGVAGQIEKHCDRKFAYVVNDTTIFSGEKTCLVLPRYPINGTLASIQRRDTAASAWAALDLTTSLLELDNESGLVQLFGKGGNGIPPVNPLASSPGVNVFFGSQGDWERRVRLQYTWTGGYWWDTTENLSGSIPSGACAMPDDLQLAWRMQCEFIWTRKAKLGVALDGGIGRTRYDSLGAEPLSPQVVDLLQSYKRFQIE